MPLFRNISEIELARALQILGYTVTRQTGSHIRITTELNGKHHETIPAHKPLKVGTLNSIIRNIATHHGFTRDELLGKLDL